MRRKRERGQTTLEFALVIPLFTILLFGVLDAGRIVWANSSLAEAAREAARFAIVHGGWANTLCPVGPPTPEVLARLPIPPSPDCLYPSPSKQAIVELARARALAPGSLVVHVCYGDGCSGDTDAPFTTNARGTPVTVALDSDVPLAAGALLGLGPFHIRGSSTMLVNN